MGSFTLVTNEFLPVGLISDVAADLHVSEGTAGTMITVPGVIAAISALALPVLLQRVNRRVALLGLSLTFVVADVLAGLAPNYPTMPGARALLSLGIGRFWAIAVAVGVGHRLVPEQLGPRATALVFGGISIGTVVGVPAGPLLGHKGPRHTPGGFAWAEWPQRCVPSQVIGHPCPVQPRTPVNHLSDPRSGATHGTSRHPAKLPVRLCRGPRVRPGTQTLDDPRA
ncbi:MFS transporter, partial [Streptomyces sp. NPDC058247]|uniref:MFS transporter n=1 Tax=Streptomyces sp. NPDC058247 TaxID=3346401 RepID=UPI0036E0E649